MENTRGQGTSRNERKIDQDLNQQKSSNRGQSSERLSSDSQQHVSTQRGTSDMRSGSLSGVSNTPQRSGSGITEKRNVTGSDYDGQVSEE